MIKKQFRASIPQRRKAIELGKVDPLISVMDLWLY